MAEDDMLRFRPYKSCDAAAIVSWIGGERDFRKWCADRFDSYPITAGDLNRHYDSFADSDSFFPMTAEDENGPVGHLIMRFADKEKSVVRFGFVIVDNRRRGQGYGKRMLQMAASFAFDDLKAEKITLGVFENNPAARFCYLTAGFRDAVRETNEYYHILGENWKCLEMEMTSR